MASQDFDVQAALNLSTKKRKNLQAAADFLKAQADCTAQKNHAQKQEAKAAEILKREQRAKDQAEVRRASSVSDFSAIELPCNHNETQEHKGLCTLGPNGSNMFTWTPTSQHAFGIAKWGPPLKCPSHRDERNEIRRKTEQYHRRDDEDEDA